MQTSNQLEQLEIGIDRYARNGANPTCRFCRGRLEHTLVDLGMSPLCESYLRADQLNEVEPFYPLHVKVCDRCYLVQLEEYVSPERIFSEYAYFSSYSDSWLKHASNYVQMAAQRFTLGRESLCVEIGSNDGYLLQYFVAAGIPVLGVEPAANVAKAAEQKGVRSLVKFFGSDTARSLMESGQTADLIIANNVLAQVPDLNDFVAGIGILLKPDGVATLEFPHVERLIEQRQYDTIYHEHFSYFSLLTVEKVFGAHGLVVFDVEEIATHGGSIRIYVRHSADKSKPVMPAVESLREHELELKLDRIETYAAFGEQVKESKRALLDLLIRLRRDGKRIVGYGAPGKGNTLLNYCGIRTDFLDFTVDRNPYKQGRFLPGTHIPIHSPDVIEKCRPDYILILPWNLVNEIGPQLAYTRNWGAKLIVPVPEARVLD